MSALARLFTGPAGVALGLTVVLAVWETAIVALLAWAASRRRGPRQRHRIAMAAILGSVVLGVATFAVLRVAPPVGAGPVPVRAAAADRTVAIGASAEPSVPSVPSTTPVETPFRWAQAMPAVAALWTAAVLASLAHLVIGVLRARRLRRRGTVVTGGRLHEAAARLADALQVRRPVEVCRSDDVVAPATLGLRPLLLIPTALERRLPAEQIDALVGHELAHVRRGDYRTAVVQAVAEAFLVFSPAVRWLSAEARRAREECCDDVAVGLCGSASLYAGALGELATFAAVPRARLALGAGAPSLAGRVRRVLKGEVMAPMNRFQKAGLAAAMVLLALTGYAAGEASAREAARVAAGTTEEGVVPTGFIPAQYGAPVHIVAQEPANGHLFGRVRIRNVSEETLESVTFAVIVERFTPASTATLVPVEPVSVSLAPGAAQTLDVAFLPNEALLALRERGGKVQGALGVREVRFAGGRRWVLTPAASAQNAQEMLHVPEPSVSRGLVRAAAPEAGKEPHCLDDRGLPYTEGAIVAILGEPGRFAECDGSGAWVEKSLGARPVGATVANSKPVLASIPACLIAPDGSSATNTVPVALGDSARWAWERPQMVMKDGKGVRLPHVTAGSSFDKAGLKPGDVVLAADGQTVADNPAFIGYLTSREPGQVVKLRVLRSGTEIDLALTAGPGC